MTRAASRRAVVIANRCGFRLRREQVVPQEARPTTPRTRSGSGTKDGHQGGVSAVPERWRAIATAAALPPTGSGISSRYTDARPWRPGAASGQELRSGHRCVPAFEHQRQALDDGSPKPSAPPASARLAVARRADSRFLRRVAEHCAIDCSPPEGPVGGERRQHHRRTQLSRRSRGAGYATERDLVAEEIGVIRRAAGTPACAGA